ncbi:MAG TPA: hypothetical protein VFB20_07225 [Burkholderiales bacterium]|nr:hypothetical protein [Burkholderiales bacterium]
MAEPLVAAARLPANGAARNESGAHCDDLELIEIVMPADFQTVDD